MRYMLTCGSAFVLAAMSQAASADDMENDAERACGTIYDYAIRYAIRASAAKRWPPHERATKRLPSLYERCARHEQACLATREELEDRGFDDGQLNCGED